MDQKNKKKKTPPVTAQYQTYALADDSVREGNTNAAIPSDECVKSAKDWVDYNKL